MAATLGEMIHEARIARELSLRQLGSLAGIHWTNLSQMERGELIPSPTRLMSLCHHLGIDREAAIRARFEAQLARQQTAVA